MSKAQRTSRKARGATPCLCAGRRRSWQRWRIERDLERRGWPRDRAASEALDRLVVAEERLGG